MEETFGLDLTGMDERQHLIFYTFGEGKLSLESYLDRLVSYKAVVFPQ